MSAVLDPITTTSAAGANPPLRPPTPNRPSPPVRAASKSGSVSGGGANPPAPPPPTVHSTAGGDEATGIPAFGTQIQVLSSSSPEETFVSIFGVGDITGPNTSVAEVETTSHSTGNPHRTFIPTLIDDGEISFPCYWNPADPTQSVNSTYGLDYLFQNRIVTKFRLVNTDNGHRTRVFKGFVRNLGETYPVQGVCTRNVTIRITSVPTETASPVAMTPESATPTASGGADSFEVATGGAVTSPWTAATDSAWITIDGPDTPTTGDGTVDYTVAAQLPGAPARSGKIMIAALGLVFNVDQAAGV